MINWSCALKTAISDIEVESKEIKGRCKVKIPKYDKEVEVGIMHEFSYKVDGTDEEIIIDTTRLETMLGDVAVAAHPDDKRYQKYKGKYLKHPFLDKKIPFIFDSFVDPNFGTGAVKITPAHDFDDF